MRLEEWQKFIESQFLEDAGAADAEQAATPAPDAAETKNGGETNEATETGAANPTAPYAPVTEKPVFDPASREAKPLLSLPLIEETPEETPLFAADACAETKAESESENKAVTEAAKTDAPPPAYRQTLDFDAEIPDFANYLPSRRQAPPETASETRPVPVSETVAAQRDVPAAQPETSAFVQSMTEEDQTQAAAPEPKTPAKSDAEIPFRGPRPTRSRARHARNVRPENVPSGLSAADLWAKAPRHLQTLLTLERIEEKEIAQSSYKRPFAEGRLELIERLLDPILSLEDTARLLNVCPTTVRRYTNRGILTHYRKEPERNGETDRPTERETRQRRFRLSDILAFLETQQTALEADRQAERRPSKRKSAELSEIA